MSPKLRGAMYIQHIRKVAYCIQSFFGIGGIIHRMVVWGTPTNLHTAVPCFMAGCSVRHMENACKSIVAILYSQQWPTPRPSHEAALHAGTFDI